MKKTVPAYRRHDIAFLSELWNRRFEPPGAARHPSLAKEGKFHN